MRCTPSCNGRLKVGTVCEPMLVPCSRYWYSLLLTSSPIFSCASSVEPPICGVRITLGMFCNGVLKMSPFFCGSTGNTSIAAPANGTPFQGLGQASRLNTSPPAEVNKQSAFLKYFRLFLLMRFLV